MVSARFLWALLVVQAARARADGAPPHRQLEHFGDSDGFYQLSANFMTQPPAAPASCVNDPVEDAACDYLYIYAYVWHNLYADDLYACFQYQLGQKMYIGVTPPSGYSTLLGTSATVPQDSTGSDDWCATNFGSLETQKIGGSGSGGITDMVNYLVDGAFSFPGALAYTGAMQCTNPFKMETLVTLYLNLSAPIRYSYVSQITSCRFEVHIIGPQAGDMGVSATLPGGESIFNTSQCATQDVRSALPEPRAPHAHCD